MDRNALRCQGAGPGFYICQRPNCDNEINPKRYKLGYKTCLECGSPPLHVTVAPAYNKGAYQVIPQSDIKDIGRK